MSFIFHIRYAKNIIVTIIIITVSQHKKALSEKQLNNNMYISTKQIFFRKKSRIFRILFLISKKKKLWTHKHKQKDTTFT